jgi:hypothetical protein
MAGMQGIVRNNPCPAVEGGEASDEVDGFEQHVGGAI